MVTSLEKTIKTIEKLAKRTTSNIKSWSNFLYDWMQLGTLNIIQDHRWLIEVVNYYCDGYGSQAKGQILHQFAPKKNTNKVN
jgi:hypothetical protein